MISLFKLTFLLFLYPLGSLGLRDTEDGYTVLKAATKRSDLVQRNNGIPISKNVSLIYADGDYGTGFWSNVEISSTKPVLLLEDIDHHLDLVQCSESTIKIGFHTAETFDIAKDVLMSIAEGYMITSHTGCNQAGDRQPFEIKSSSYYEASMVFTFSVVQKQWHDVGDVSVQFEQSTEALELRRAPLLRRQATVTQTAGSAQTTVIATDATTITATSRTVDLAWNVSPTPLSMPPPYSDLFSSLVCTDCKGTGLLNWVYGGWDFRLSNLAEVLLINDNLAATDVFDAGVFDMTLQNFSVYIDMTAEFSTAASSSIPLATIRFHGFEIPSLFAFNLVFEVDLVLNWTLSEGISVGYGFQIDAPETIILNIDLIDPTQSQIQGLSSATVSAVPFQSNLTDLETDMSMSFRTRVAAEFDLQVPGLPGENASLSAGVHLDLPKASIQVAQLASNTVDENCNSSGDLLTDPDFDQIYHNLTHVTGDIGIDAGPDLTASWNTKTLTWSTDLASTQLTSFPTACLAYNSTSGSYVTAAAAVEAVKNVGPSQFGSFLFPTLGLMQNVMLSMSFIALTMAVFA